MVMITTLDGNTVSYAYSYVNQLIRRRQLKDAKLFDV